MCLWSGHWGAREKEAKFPQEQSWEPEPQADAVCPLLHPPPQLFAFITSAGSETHSEGARQLAFELRLCCFLAV